MPNRYILDAVKTLWAGDASPGKKLLDLSCGHGHSARMLAATGASVVATEYGSLGHLGAGILCVGGVDLNGALPFKCGCFDGVNLTEVIEHIENQAQLIREIARVLKLGGVVAISTPNVLNVHSRLRFLFTGFLRGRVRPAHYSHPPGQAPNIYLLHFYELYYLFFHSGLEVQQLCKTRIKFAPVFFTILFYPLMWIFSLEAVIRAEKDPVQRGYNWQILRWLLSAPLLLSDNIVVKARKTRRG
ncbi:MAG TPA: methyltransferase domain-containing protein [Candidatus Binatia bacterium]